MSEEIIYINVADKAPYADATGADYVFQPFTAGEERAYGLRLLKRAFEGSLIEDGRQIKSLRASLGLIDARPAGGGTAYWIGEEASTAANTTVVLPWNHNARAMQDAINALTAVTAAHGLATAAVVPGGFTVIFADAEAAVSIRSASNTLWPISDVNSLAYEVAGVWLNEVRLTQLPFVFTSTVLLVLPPAPSVVAVQDGASVAAGTYLEPEVQDFVLPAEFAGTYQFRNPDSMARSAILSQADRIAQIQEALSAIYPDGTVEARLIEDGRVRVTWRGDYLGADLPLMEVLVVDAPPGDPTFTLDCKQAGAFVALRAVPEANVVLEVKALLAAADAEEEDTGVPVVLFRRAAVLARGENWDKLATVVPPRWLRPPNPVNYIPSNEDAFLVATPAWAGAVGDGVASVIDIAHGLDTDAIAGVMVRANSAGGAVMVHGTDYTFVMPDADTLRLTLLGGAPEVDALYVVIRAAGAVEMYNAHTHTTDEITGLDAQLESLFEITNALQDLYESVGIPATSAGTTGRVTVLRKVIEVLHYRGETVVGDEGVDEKLLQGRAPLLLPAVHDASVEALPDPQPDPTANAGKVYQNDSGSAVQIATGGGIRGYGDIPDDGFVGCDGIALFAVRQDGETNSFFPIPFERSLFTLAVNDMMMPVNRTLEVLFGVQVQLIGAPCTAQWFLIVELGVVAGETDPDPVGVNLEKITWADTPVIEQRLILTEQLDAHFFGVRIKRETTEMLMDKILYGVAAGANDDAPASANFVLRARLARFDTENNVARQRGWVFHQLFGSLTTAEDGTQTITPAKAVIS